MSEAFQCYISGRVQGVFFRESTKEKALELGLTGYARNLMDGRVEVYACGARARLEAFKAWLEEGPPAANVTEVKCEPAAHRRFDGFETC